MNQTDPTAALRDRIADAIRAAACPGDCGKTEEECARERIQPFVWHHGKLAGVEGSPEQFADAVLAVLGEQTDRAAVLREAADVLSRMDYDTDSNDYGYDTYRDAWNGGVMDAADLLRRLAVEAHDTGTQQAAAPDELATARATNQRLNYEKQRLESELAAYRRAVSQWEVSEHGTYVPLRTIAAIARAAGRDIETPQWLLHYQRVEQAEAAIDRVRQLHDRLAEETDLTSPDDSITRGAAAKRIATALDGWTPPAPVAQQPAADYEATTGHLVTCLAVAGGGSDPDCPCARAEQQPAAADGQEHVCKPGATVYYCPTVGEVESDCHGGFDVCCDRPDLHRPACGKTQGVDGHRYSPCARTPGHREAYCVSANGHQLFIAAAAP